MRYRIPLLIAIVVAALALHGRCARDGATSAPPPVTRVDTLGASGLAQADGIVVDFRDDVDPAEIARLATELGVDLHPNSPFSKDTRLTVANVAPDRVQTVLEALRRNPRVESAEPNFLMAGLWEGTAVPVDQLVRPLRSARPNDPLYKFQWHMHKIDVEKAWATTDGKGVVVAVIDTGVAYENYDKFHRVEDLAQTRFVAGWNFVAGNAHANDDHGHGTHVAGTVAQSTNNGVGVVGVAPGAAIMPIKVLSARGTGKISDIAEGIRFAADHGAKVINMSLGGPMGSSVLESAVKYAAKHGVVIVCAAGNSNSESVGYPARYPQCIAVSATRFDDQLTFYSNRGKRIDIAAPGGDMNVDQNGDGYKDGVLQNTIALTDPTNETYALYQGTSMAAPHVAGAAAILVANGITRPDAVLARLKETARKDGLDLDKGYGGGVLDLGRATAKAAFAEPLARVVLALACLGLLLWGSPVRPRIDAALGFGLLMGSAGLFFLPWLGVPAPAVLTTAMPDWDLPITGVHSHANALLWSALLPFGLAVASMGVQRLKQLCLGLSVGVGAFLLHQLAYPTAVIQGLGWQVLQPAWLLLNAAACLFVAYVLCLPLREVADRRGDGVGRGKRASTRRPVEAPH